MSNSVSLAESGWFDSTNEIKWFDQEFDDEEGNVTNQQSEQWELKPCLNLPI